MSACEICWSKAWTRATGSGRPVDEVYREVLKEARSHSHPARRCHPADDDSRRCSTEEPA